MEDFQLNHSKFYNKILKQHSFYSTVCWSELLMTVVLILFNGGVTVLVVAVVVVCRIIY